MIKEYLINNIDNYSWNELTKNINTLFNKQYTISGIRKIAERQGLKKNSAKNKEHCYTYPKDFREWLKNNYTNYTYDELVDEVDKRFKIKTTSKKIKNYINEFRKKYGLFLRTKSNFYVDDKWLSENVSKYHLQGLTRQYNKTFNTQFSATKIADDLIRLGIKNKLRKEPRIHTQEELDFIKSIIAEYSDKRIAELYQEKFGKYISEKAISHIRIRKKLGKKDFKYHPRGIEVPSYVKIGQEKLDHRNTVVLKTEKGFVEKKRYLYEKYHNIKLNKEDSIMNLDGNPYNCSKDNLVKLSVQERNRLIGNKYHGKGKLTEAAIELIKTEIILETKFKK